MSKDHRPSARAGLENWRNSELPFFKKFGVMMRNEMLKAIRLKNCCGEAHHGEPGC